jgi:CheY-like chemotaxis protein
MTGAAANRYTVIIVENDDDEREFMREGFTESGKFEILALVKNGDTLLEWLAGHQERPQLVLSDLNMPGKNGYDIIEQLRDYPGSPIPVIITSTSTTRSIIDKCLQKGAADYVVKPDTFIEYRQFAEKLHHLITQKNIAGK